MAYCTISDVEGLYRDKSFNKDSAPKISFVTTLINNTSAMINGRIASKYRAPVISGDDAVAILKDICMKSVAADIDDILYEKKTEGRGSETRSTKLRNEVKKKLDMIETGELDLPGATATTQARIGSYNSDNSIEPTFKKGVDQW